MRSISATFIVFIFGTVLFSSCNAFGLVNQNSNANSPTTTAQIPENGESFLQSRQNFFAAAATAMTAAAVLSPKAALAAEDYVKGSKNDPDVQAKLSVCMYECTKPKGDEQKSRAECLKECKTKLITARANPIQ